MGFCSCCCCCCFCFFCFCLFCFKEKGRGSQVDLIGLDTNSDLPKPSPLVGVFADAVKIFVGCSWFCCYYSDWLW